MTNIIKSITIAAIAVTSLVGVAPEVKAGTMNCYGSENYQSCTYSDWVNGEYVTCYGSITKYSENWNCF